MENQGVRYNVYRFSKVELINHSAMGAGFFFVMGLIFFGHMLWGVVAMSGVFLYLKEKKKIEMKNRKVKLREAFKEAMYTLSSSLGAGRSAEQAFIQTLNDLNGIYEEDCDIIKEFTLIVQKLHMNETIESALLDLAERTDIEEIHNFTSVFIMAKKSGGDMIRIVKETSHMIHEKIEIQKEIDLLVVQKQFEQKILSYIIPGMIVFFQLVAPEFLRPLYTTFEGRVVMMIALGLYLLSSKIGKNIVTIEV
jgi:tight adherence protein B